MDTNNRLDWKAQPPSPPPAIQSQMLSRVIGVVRGLSGIAGLISLGVFVGEVTLPEDYRPSTVIGRFHGRLEAADAAAKMGTVPEYTRKNAEAAAQPPAFAAMETDAFREQQRVLADSLKTESALANTADLACTVGNMFSPYDRDLGWFGNLLTQACGMGRGFRADMMDQMRRGGQDNSVLIQRPRPSGSGQ